MVFVSRLCSRSGGLPAGCGHWPQLSLSILSYVWSHRPWMARPGVQLAAGQAQGPALTSQMPWLPGVVMAWPLQPGCGSGPQLSLSTISKHCGCSPAVKLRSWLGPWASLVLADSCAARFGERCLQPGCGSGPQLSLEFINNVWCVWCSPSVKLCVAGLWTSPNSFLGWPGVVCGPLQPGCGSGPQLSLSLISKHCVAAVQLSSCAAG